MINRASVFGFGVIDGGHATASRFLHVVFSVCIRGMTISDNSDLYPTRKYSVFPPCPALRSGLLHITSQMPIVIAR